MNQPSSINIVGVEIRQDHEGRFCVNDLHRAAGGEKRHQPSNWLAGRAAQEMAALLEERTGVPCIISRQKLGTFVSKELVYAYAMWVSAEFHLEVISAYDKYIRNRQVPNALPDFSDPVAAARAWADEAERVRKLTQIATEQREHLQAALPALEFHKAVTQSADSLTVAQFSKLMGTGEIVLFRQLRHDKILITGGARNNLPYQNHLDLGRFEVVEKVIIDGRGERRLSCQTRITPKGQLWLQQKYFPQVQVSQQQRLNLVDDPQAGRDRAIQAAAQFGRPSHDEGFRDLARVAVHGSQEVRDSTASRAEVIPARRDLPLYHPDQDCEASRQYIPSHFMADR